MLLLLRVAKDSLLLLLQNKAVLHGTGTVMETAWQPWYLQSNRVNIDPVPSEAVRGGRGAAWRGVARRGARCLRPPCQAWPCLVRPAMPRPPRLATPLHLLFALLFRK